MGLAADDRRYLWHPFTQQRGWEHEEPLVVTHADGCWLFDDQGRRYIDGVSSLWCTVHGHRHPVLDIAVKDQLDRVAHSTMLGLTHEPAIELARRLVELAPGDLARVFYSDSGSTAAEIALKMAFQYWQQRGGEDARRTRFVSLRDAYHGDTIGSVSVGGIDLFHSLYRPLLFDSLKAEPGDAADMERVLAEHAGEVAAVIVEPLVQGAAGMLVHPPGYLSRVRELCDEHGVFLICDEGVYEGFLGEHRELKTFFHGHTYTGNPLACAAALATLEIFERERTIERLQVKIELLARWLERYVAPLE